jgi:predicted Zn-dependent protease
MLPHVVALRPDAEQWRWELKLIDRDVINAHVLPGGKITFYTGIIRKLSLTDDEIAAVMGHEIAHALREHTREKLSASLLADTAIAVTSSKLGTGGTQLALVGKQIGLELPFSRAMESEADAYGLELTARAGFDPQGAVRVWEKMMESSSGRGPVTFLSTHPSTQQRRDALEALLPSVQPLYEAALLRLPAQAIPATVVAPGSGEFDPNVRRAAPALSATAAVELAEQALRCRTLSNNDAIETGLKKAGLLVLVKELPESNGRMYAATDLSLFALKVNSVTFHGTKFLEKKLAIEAVFQSANQTQLVSVVKPLHGNGSYRFSVDDQRGGGRVMCSTQGFS